MTKALAPFITGSTLRVSGIAIMSTVSFSPDEGMHGTDAPNPAHFKIVGELRDRFLTYPPAKQSLAMASGPQVWQAVGVPKRGYDLSQLPLDPEVCEVSHDRVFGAAKVWVALVIAPQVMKHPTERRSAGLI